MEDPREDHWNAVKWVLHYVRGTMDQGIVIPKPGGGGGLQLTVFSQALPKPTTKVGCSSQSSAMQTWRATLMGGGAPLVCSSSSDRPRLHGSR
jgi:hypothetical protein